MNQQSPPGDAIGFDPRAERFSLSRAVFLFGVVFLLSYSLTPYSAAGKPIHWPQRISRLVEISPYAVGPVRDLVAHGLLLFIIGAAAGLSVRTTTGRWWMAGAIALLTLGIEGVQLFLPDRHAHVFDITAHWLGGGMGLAFGEAVHCRWPVANWSDKWITERTCRWLFAASLIGLTALLNRNAGQQSLESWDRAYPLLIGNESTLDRPWLGRLRLVAIYDRALSAKEVSRSFSAIESGDRTGAGPCIAFGLDASGRWTSWGESELIPSFGSDTDRLVTTDGLDFSSPRLLRTKSPPTELVERIVKHGAFSVEIYFSTDDLQQIGPARIVSISDGPVLRNFTLGQRWGGMEFRVRNGHTGRNGTLPRIFSRFDVLREGRWTHAVATYAPGVARVFIDGLPAARPLRYNALPIVAGLGEATWSDATAYTYRLAAGVVVTFPLAAIGFVAFRWSSRTRAFACLIAGILLAVGISWILQWLVAGSTPVWENAGWLVVGTTICWAAVSRFCVERA